VVRRFQNAQEGLNTLDGAQGENWGTPLLLRGSMKQASSVLAE